MPLKVIISMWGLMSRLSANWSVLITAKVEPPPCHVNVHLVKNLRIPTIRGFSRTERGHLTTFLSLADWILKEEDFGKHCANNSRKTIQVARNSNCN